MFVYLYQTKAPPVLTALIVAPAVATVPQGTTQAFVATGYDQYVRVYGTQRGTPYGYLLWEFEVYGVFVSDLALVTRNQHSG